MKQYDLKETLKAYKAQIVARDRLSWARDHKASAYASQEVDKYEHQYHEAMADFRALEKTFDDMIRDAEGRATERCAMAVTIIRALCEVDERLNITARAKEGVTAVLAPGTARLPGAYRYPAKCTFVSVVFKRGSWRCVDIYRDYQPQGGAPRAKVTLTDEARDAVLFSVCNMK